MTKTERIEQLVNKYYYWNNQDNNNTDRWNRYIARDNKRKIIKVFQREIHEPIENYLKRR